MFSNNSLTSEGSGGALAIGTLIPIWLSVIVSFTGFSKVIFSNNTAKLGGALHVYCQGDPLNELIFQGNTNVTFNNNKAKEGGVCIILLLQTSHSQEVL